MQEEKEAYQLEVTDMKITIRAQMATGIFYGIQSLRQLIKSEAGKWIIPKLTITDYPALSWRSFMLDEGRYFKGEKVVKQILDEMALLKMNVFQWHLTDDQGWRIEIKNTLVSRKSEHFATLPKWNGTKVTITTASHMADSIPRHKSVIL